MYESGLVEINRESWYNVNDYSQWSSIQMKIDLSKYNDYEIFIRDGKECFLDKTKHILRIATPEEKIRQRIVDFLHDEMAIPYAAMETEIPVSYFVAGEKGRMDVVVYGLKEGQRCPVMVVECKAEEIEMTEAVYIQAKRYSEIIDIPVLMVTNGIELDILAWNYETENYDAIEYLPVYSELCEPEKLEKISLKEIPYERHSYDELFTDETIDMEYYYAEYVGKDCKKSMVPHVVNIAECFRDTTHKITDLQINGYKFIEDGGIRYTSFGNAAGGYFDGFFRYFIIEDRHKNTQIISMTVAGCNNGRSLLIVAVDDIDKHHNSLQLSIEHFSLLVGSKMKLWHDGTLTVGNKGKAKKQEVLDFVEANSSLNVNGNRILLGELDLSDLLYVDSKGMKTLIGNLIEYAIVRDEFRSHKK